MIDDILASILDLFDNDTTLMIVVATGLCGSALLFLIVRIKTIRGSVARRVAGKENVTAMQAGGSLPAPESGIKKMLGGVIANLAQTAGQSDRSQTRVLRTRLTQAGYYDQQALVWFFGLRIFTALIFAIVTAIAVAVLMQDSSNIALVSFSLIGCALGFIAPSIGLDRRIKKLQMEHSRGFPDFMDLMVVCAQAGLSMEAGINRIAGEIGIAFPSLARNLDLTAREIRSGKPLSKAIESLAGRLGIKEATSFSTLLQQSEELGSSLTQSLRTYSDDMRNKRLMKAEEKAYALPAKLVIPLTLFVFPVLLVVLMLPVAISVSSSNM